jgi:hypothetical protein
MAARTSDHPKVSVTKAPRVLQAVPEEPIHADVPEPDQGARVQQPVPGGDADERESRWWDVDEPAFA